MSDSVRTREFLDKGEVGFSVESRVLRDLGERLVKSAEVAILELVKNSYDADALECTIDATNDSTLIILDDGVGMTLSQFVSNWMRVGTSAKARTANSPRFGRLITGDKGIGRFAVRFLGNTLKLTSVARDRDRGTRTRLRAEFDWGDLDGGEELSRVRVPYTLESVSGSVGLGTELQIGGLRVEIDALDWRQVRTGAMGVVSPSQSLLRSTEITSRKPRRVDRENVHPGFELSVITEDPGSFDGDLSAQILDRYVLKAHAKLSREGIVIEVHEREEVEPLLRIVDTFANDIGRMRAELRFFPRRKGTFDGSQVDGRRAYRWIKGNSGVAVYDRGFRVLPYGTERDDWLQLSEDTARNRRDPRSEIARKHFGMSPKEKQDTAGNWMLRLPQSAQLIGVVQVQGRRSEDQTGSGLIASADREGFVHNRAFRQLFEVIRGATEMIAVADRMMQQRADEEHHRQMVRRSREETKAAVREIKKNNSIPEAQKHRVVTMLIEAQDRIERQDTSVAKRQSQLEIMSLLGVVAGYMTHEFGLAMHDLRGIAEDLSRLARESETYRDVAHRFSARIRRLEEFSMYSRAYIEGTRRAPSQRFRVRPRIRQVVKLLGRYAEERRVRLEIGVDHEVYAPAVPATLYNGVLQNLYTNALKAVTARAGREQMRIAFRSWNDKNWHFLQVSDTGVGIPSVLHDRVFDPLFSTTDLNADPLGSGMGLGLSLVRRGAEAFGGSVNLVEPPPGFSTCVQLRLPRSGDEEHSP